MSRPSFTRSTIEKKWRGKVRCACCDQFALHALTWKNGWFRGDDDDESVCDAHLALAKNDSKAFWRLVEQRKQYLDTVIDAQHEETGRLWKGTRRTLPPRYTEVRP